MKITYFVNQYPKISHTFIRREIQALEALGFEIQRVALRGWRESLPDPDDRAEQGKTQYVLRRGVWGLVLPTISTLLALPRRFFGNLLTALRISRQTDHRHIYHIVYALEACVLRTWTRRFGSQHLHAHFGTNSAEVALYLRNLNGPRYSFTAHGPEEFSAPMALEEKIARSEFTVAISSFGRSQIFVRCTSKYWPKVKVIPCGIDRAFYESAIAEPSYSQTLVCVGRLCEAKGQLLLLEASKLLVERGVNFQLVLAGDGPLRPAIEASITRLGLADRVRITGWICSREVRRELLSARALVLPSFAEGLPVVIMEAMSLRRPIITTFIAGIPELVHDGEHGWVVPAGSIDDLATAMADCLRRPDTDIVTMGQACRAQVLRRHAIEDAARALSSLLRTVTPAQR